MEIHIPKVKEVMVSNPIVTYTTANIEDVAKIFVEKKIGCLPVMDSDSHEFAGLISEKEVVEELTNDSLSRFFFETPLKRIIVQDPICLHPTEDLFSATEIFKKKKLRHAPVLEDGHLVGIVSRKDLLKGILKFLKNKEKAYMEKEERRVKKVETLSDHYRYINSLTR